MQEILHLRLDNGRATKYNVAINRFSQPRSLKEASSVKAFGDKLRILSEEEISRIDGASKELLDLVGLTVYDKELLSILQQQGCKVDFPGSTVRIDPTLLESALEEAPEVVLLCGRDPQHDLLLNGERFHTRIMGGAPNIVDAHTRDQRTAKISDLAPCARLVDGLESIDASSMFPVSPTVPLLDVYDARTCFCNTSKFLHYVCHNRDLIDYVIDIASIVAGGAAALKKRPLLSGLVESLSPLAFEQDNAAVLKKFAVSGLPLAVHAHPIAGVSSPVTLADELVVLNAEVIGLIAIAELYRPGTSAIYGISASVPDMKTGLNLAGAIENALLGCAGAQMARYYGLPSTMSAGSDSKMVDAQAAIERVTTLALPAAAGIDLVNMTSANGKLAFSPAQLVVDNEVVRVLRRFERGIDFDDSLIVTDMFLEGGRSTSFLKHKHTVQNFREQLLDSALFSRESWQEWVQSGRESLEDRAWERATCIIEQHDPIELEDSKKADIDELVASVEKERGISG